MDMDEVPIACRLSALELERCASELLPGLVRRASAIVAAPSGARLTFAAEPRLIADIGAVIERERGCCPFFDFLIEIPAGRDELTLVISGPEGTREFLRSLASELAPDA
jgi:hypothetical protein